MTDTQKIFLLSKVNGSDNFQDLLPSNQIKWPSETWLTKRREELQERENQS